jgi:hypothetical protein
MSSEHRQTNGTSGARTAMRSPSPERRLRLVRNHEHTKPTRRATSTYLKHALLHPWHVVVLAGATVFGVANWSLIVLLLVFAGAEAVLLGVVMRLPSFRHYVDAKLDQIERAHAAEARAALLLQMSDDHRRELVRLEHVLDKIRGATHAPATSVELAVDDCLALLATFVRLAIAYNTSRECLASIDRRALSDEIHALQVAAASPSAQTRSLAERRILIAQKRAERWDRTREDLEAIAHQLAMIGALIQLTHEQFSAPADPGGMTDEIDRVVSDLQENQSTLDELADIFAVEEPIEPRLLDMGRAAQG